MTNAEIIMRESEALMAQGILASAGTIEVQDEDGNKHEVDVPEDIHTYQGWKQLGSQVKKGEHAVARFAIWTPSKRKMDDDTDEAKKVDAKPNMWLSTAYWFKASQVEEVKQ